MRAQRTALLRITHGSPLHREGKNSHRPYGAPPSKREASYNHSRKYDFPAVKWLQKASLRYVFCPPVCRSRGLRRKSECGAAILLRLRRREKPNAEPKANVGVLFPLRHCCTAALAKKISQKDFLRRGAASVLSAAFGAAEPPARCAPPRRRQFEKNFVKYLTSFSSSWSWKAKVLRAFPSRRHGRAGCGRSRWAEHPLRATPLPSPRRR